MIDLAQHPLVETEWLAAHLNESPSELRIIDARWRGEGMSGLDLYQIGHVPGAVHLDWQFDLSRTDEAGLRYMLLPPRQFEEVMNAAGIGDGTPVVAYADEDYSGATRLWWALRYYGHRQVAVLNGGWDKWLAEGRPISTRVDFEIKPAQFTCRPQPNWLAEATEIERILKDNRSGVSIVDTRPPEQYAGRAVWTPPGSLFLPTDATEVNVGARQPMRSGHIPGAVNIQSSTNLDPTNYWTFRPSEVLGMRARSKGLQPDQRIITYCGVGISASLGLFALHLAGYQNLALYDASWEEWGTDPTRPVEF